MQDYLRYATVILEWGKMLIKSQKLYILEYAGLPPLRYGDPGMGEMLIKSQNFCILEYAGFPPLRYGDPGMG